MTKINNIMRRTKKVVTRMKAAIVTITVIKMAKMANSAVLQDGKEALTLTKKAKNIIKAKSGTKTNMTLTKVMATTSLKVIETDKSNFFLYL